MGTTAGDPATVWEGLVAEGTVSGGFLRIRVAGLRDWALYAAVEKPADRTALLLEVPTRAIKSAQIQSFQSQGLQVDVDTLEAGHSGRLRIVLRLGALDFREVFVMFATTIIAELRHAVTAEQATVGLNSQVARWQRFLTQFGPGALSEHGQLGLYGELHTLLELAQIIGLQDAIRGWRGPAGSPQDFQFGTAVVEVKATRSGPPHLLRISSINQLDVSEQIHLVVRHTAFERMQGGKQTLNRLVSTVRSGISAGPASEREFELKLADSGYLDAHSRVYESYGYVERRTSWLWVREGFPRILAQDLPAGVGDVTYSVQLAAVSRFEIQRAELVELLTKGASK